MSPSSLDTAIAQAGSGAALAKAVGVSPMAVSHWKVRGVPARHVLHIESVTGVSRHELRPDLYPEAPPTMTQTITETGSHHSSTEVAVNPSSTGGAQ
ncbi:transcriptional regulator [Pseudomonas putida]|uniref:Helix-turn-helix domain-containing protein n=2 Tax=Pseudomonas juntendi TaxID=2666183 RepID=A0A7W2LZW8_9PSED|nr:YdaS family helix-turn-helix protein [Pseudomonas putida]MBA6150106.1 helix-turn-helix domain-containing protein [Pseudomonas juntendi]MCL8308148.1 helix-turn-helix domain-containing protein [Pseudomonas putida]